jgi:uncharacterized protein YjbI with pentapeptide repeats
MKYEIKHRGNGSVLFSLETESIKLCVEAAAKAKVNLSGSDLSYSNLSYSDLRGSNLSNSDLRGSNLSNSNLRGSNLSGSDLSGSDLINSDLSYSDLRGSNLSNSNLSNSNLSEGTTIISVSGIGSARRMTTYWIEQDKVWCECFIGTMDEFEAQITETHAEGTLHRDDYLAVVRMFTDCARRRGAVDALLAKEGGGE